MNVLPNGEKIYLFSFPELYGNVSAGLWPLSGVTKWLTGRYQEVLKYSERL